MACMPSETPYEKTNFSFKGGYQLKRASGLKMWACVYLPSQVPITRELPVLGYRHEFLEGCWGSTLAGDLMFDKRILYQLKHISSTL